MRILFVYPNLKGQLGFHYGLASLSAVLKRAGHETGLINLNEKAEPPPSPEAFRKRVADFRPDLVGFSVVTPQYRVALDLAREVKAASTVPVVFGGVHATMVPEKVVREEAVDFVCVGEGEDALLELVEALASGRGASRLRNIWTMTDGEVSSNPVRPLPDLSTLPMHDHDLFDFDALTEKKGGWVGLLASRGCPFRCSYCFNHRMVDRYRRELGVSASELGYVRHVPVEALIAEIEAILARDAEVKMFIFDDDLFTHDSEYVLAFCGRYGAISKVPITVNAHVKRFTAKIAGALKKAGTRIVKFGVESGSPRIRSEVMNRHMSNGDIVGAVARAHEAGLVTSAFVMMGLPRETPGDLDQTFDLLAEARPGRFRWSTFFPFPGTDAFEMAEADGSLDREALENLDSFFETSCLDLGPEMNLRVLRARWMFPWHVNARLPAPTGTRYAELVRRYESMDEASFARVAGQLRRLDAEEARADLAAGGDPYRILFNDFMAVRKGAGAEGE